MCLSPALAYVSGDGIKKDDLLTEAILVATYRGTCGKRESNTQIRPRRNIKMVDRAQDSLLLFIYLFKIAFYYFVKEIYRLKHYTKEILLLPGTEHQYPWPCIQH
jgi:hypothetical protein